MESKEKEIYEDLLKLVSRTLQNRDLARAETAVRILAMFVNVAETRERLAIYREQYGKAQAQALESKRNREA